MLGPVVGGQGLPLSVDGLRSEKPYRQACQCAAEYAAACIYGDDGEGAFVVDGRPAAAGGVAGEGFPEIDGGILQAAGRTEDRGQVGLPVVALGRMPGRSDRLWRVPVFARGKSIQKAGHRAEFRLTGFGGLVNSFLGFG